MDWIDGGVEPSDYDIIDMEDAMDTEIKTIENEELSQALYEAGQWAKDNPEAFVDNIRVDHDKLSGMWVAEIRYIDES